MDDPGRSARELLRAWRSRPAFSGRVGVTALHADGALAVTIELPADDAMSAATRSLELVGELLDRAGVEPARALIMLVSRSS